MEMTKIGLPVPAGFTIGIPACEEYYKSGRKLPKSIVDEIKVAVAKLEKTVGKKLGDSKDPLLVSVRSGAARSMPGMLETILNLGLTTSPSRVSPPRPAIRVSPTTPTAASSDVLHHRHGSLQGAHGGDALRDEEEGRRQE